MAGVERRSPKNLYHKMSAEELQKLSSEFRWNTYFTKIGLPALQSLNVETPVFFPKMSKEIRKENLSAWKAYLRWHLVHANARFLSSRVCERGLQFLGDAWRH